MMMKSIISGFVFSTLLMAGCQQGGNSLDAKKGKLKEYNKEMTALQKKIDKLELEIADLDTTQSSNDHGVYVTTLTIEPRTFEHYIEVQGIAESRENVLISAELGGTVKRILVKEGKWVSKGTLLMQLDDEVLQSNIGELRTSLDLASTIYQKQKNLWDQKIGSEIQYLEAKSKMESLQKKIQSLIAQFNKTQIKSPVSGTVDETFIKEGEMAGPGSPLVRVVNLNTMYLEADVSETYVSALKKGDSVTVQYPALDMEEKAVLSAVGQYINPDNRTFKVEVSTSNDHDLLKPNLLAIISIRDRVISSALVVPTKYIQQHKGTNYVYIARNGENGKMVADKTMIDIGDSHQGETLVTGGIQANDILIQKGFKQVTDGDNLIIKN